MNKIYSTILDSMDHVHRKLVSISNSKFKRKIGKLSFVFDGAAVLGWPDGKTHATVEYINDNDAVQYLNDNQISLLIFLTGTSIKSGFNRKN